MPTILRAGLLVGFLFFFSPSRVGACDCVYPNTPCKAFAGAAYVFSGRVVKVLPIRAKSTTGNEYEQRLVSVEVERNYRGVDKRNSVEIVTGNSDADCGFLFREGERYLIYAYRGSDPGKFYASSCSRTQILSQAGLDLEYLEKKDDPAHGAGIEGWIDELSRGKDNNTDVKGPLAGVRLKIEGASGHWTTVTGKDGRFSLWGLKPGKYQIVPEWGARFVPMNETVKVEERSCAEVRFLATPPRHE
jgi:Tissue inhibitor of metalloproteinase